MAKTKAKSQHRDPRQERVKNMRYGRTLIGGSWRDGRVAPWFQVVGSSDFASDEGRAAILEANAKYEGHMRVVAIGFVFSIL